MFKILVATDGSKCAYKAADYAGFLARMIEDAEITILSVIDAGAHRPGCGSPACITCGPVRRNGAGSVGGP